MSLTKRFELRNDDAKQNCIKYIESIGVSKDKPMSVVASSFVKHRTTNQNRLFHSYVKELASTLGMDADKLKDMIKITFLGYSSELNPITGIWIEVARHTGDLTTEEFDTLIKEVVNLLQIHQRER